MLNPIYISPKDFIPAILIKKIKLEKLEKDIDIIENFINEYSNKEYEKNSDIRSFLEKLHYSDYKIFDGEKLENGKGIFDLAIAESKDDRYKVLIEVKKPTSNEMIEELDDRNDNFFKKAFYQVIYYYLSDKFNTLFDYTNSSKAKFLIITNYISWYFIRTSDIEALNKIYNFPYINNLDTTSAYNVIEKYFTDIQKKDSLLTEVDLPYTKFNLIKIFQDKNTITLKENIKIFLNMLSPEYLLETSGNIDKNKISKKFYQELFYIIGLKETKDRLLKPIDNNFSFLALIESKLNKNLSKEEKFEQSMELIIVWISRILFIQLFSSVLVKYKILNNPILSKNNNYGFCDINTLFFEILNSKKRRVNLRKELNFEKIPYINSSLFQKSDIEISTGITIDCLPNDQMVEFYKDSQLERIEKKYSINILMYLIKFLNSYDIAIDENFNDNSDNDLINASVLGMVFEKLNGYKEGSFYTPSFITEYMSNSIIERKIIEKFNNNGFIGTTIDEIGNQTNRKNLEVMKEIFNSIRICDNAVGSGHFLVSSLNSMLLYKCKLGLFEHIKYNQAVIIDDMFIVNDLEDYNKNEINSTSHKIYEELYESKKQIISNSLFGVDINPKSVYISRLRLWIELLKHTYFTDLKNLALLPNIDINIKLGNSLISNYALDFKFNETKKNKLIRLKELVMEYKKPDNLRSEIGEEIELIKFELDDNYCLSNKFEWRYEFPEVLDDNGDFIGFDIIIGNPPYVATDKIENNMKEFFRKKYVSAKGRLNLYVLFCEAGLNILNKNGLLSYIIPYTILKNSSYHNLRKHILDNYSLDEIVNFENTKIFTDAVVDSIIITIGNYQNSNDVRVIEKINSFKNNNYLMNVVSQNDFKTGGYTFDIDSNSLIKRINIESQKLGEIINFKQGIITGDNKKFVSKNKKEGVVKILNGRDFDKYSINFDNNYLDYNDSKIHRRRKVEIFETKKILLRQTASFPIATIDDEYNYYTLDTIHNGMLIDNKYSLEYITAILNSKLMRYVYEIKTNEGSKVFAQVKIKNIKELPIKNTSKNIQDRVTCIVKELMDMKKVQQNSLLLENELENIVYSIYDIKESEINMINALYDKSIEKNKQSLLQL